METGLPKKYKLSSNVRTVFHKIGLNYYKFKWLSPVHIINIKACNFINLGTLYKGAEVAPNSYSTAGAHSGLLLECKMAIKMTI
jgi:hypothetical protein